MTFRTSNLAITTISQLATATGVTPRALRHYESVGLLAPVRAKGGTRTYCLAQSQRAREIVMFRSIGVSIDEIRQLLSREASTPADTDLVRLFLEKRLEDLEGLAVATRQAIKRLDRGEQALGNGEGGIVRKSAKALEDAAP